MSDEIEGLRKLLDAQAAIIAEMRTPAEDRVSALEMELAEARAEIERLKHDLDEAWRRNRRLDEDVSVLCEQAFRRGVEAMREAAAREIERQVDPLMLRAGLAADVRDLPVPEDKP